MADTNSEDEKRARPSGTHSTEVLLRTRIEYAPKDAPRMDASFACSSPMQNISGISVEPLLRINAKSQAVTGEPGRAGSAPMTSAATTPQPAGRSRTNSAAIWRRGINVRLFECSDCSIGAARSEAGRHVQRQIRDAVLDLFLVFPTKLKTLVVCQNSHAVAQKSRILSHR